MTNPHIYNPGRTLTINLPSDVSAKLASYRRADHPDMSDEEVVAYLVRDSLIRLGVLELPSTDPFDDPETAARLALKYPLRGNDGVYRGKAAGKP